MTSPELAEEVLDDLGLLRARDPRGLLPAVAGAGAQVREVFEAEGATFDELDGLTVELPDGAWFNLRASNTEPLLRLNVEAPDEARMTELTNQVLGMVRA